VSDFRSAAWLGGDDEVALNHRAALRPALRTAGLSRGVTDMMRITDGRMSGTGFGTVVLHAAPESAVGGPVIGRS
jgi:dihydroxyacid dehydratase/phosphogluconate dehydratase